MNEQPLSEIPFDQRELSNLATMATLMTIAGVVAIASGILGIVASVVGALVGPSAIGAEAIGNVCGSALVMLVYAALGVWLIFAGRAFQRVVRTDEADQAYLVTGLRNLRNVFLLKSVVILLAVLVMCAVLTLALALGLGAPHA